MTWKTIQVVILRKPNKIDYTVVKLYRIISLLNWVTKVCGKMVANMLGE